MLATAADFMQICAESLLTAPALYFSTRILYTPRGLEPVGKPSTKGFSAVGWKVLMRLMM